MNLKFYWTRWKWHSRITNMELRLSPICAFKFPVHRNFGFCDVMWLPLLLGSRASFVWNNWATYDVMQSKMAARGKFKSKWRRQANPVLPDTDILWLVFQPKFEIREYFLQLNVRLLKEWLNNRSSSKLLLLYSLFGVWKCDETLSLVFDILLKRSLNYTSSLPGSLFLPPPGTSERSWERG